PRLCRRLGADQRSRSAAAGLKRSDLRALMVILAPVLGFTPLRDARFTTEKVPKPGREILPSFLVDFTIVSNNAPMVAFAAVLVQPVSFSIAAARTSRADTI